MYVGSSCPWLFDEVVVLVVTSSSPSPRNGTFPTGSGNEITLNSPSFSSFAFSKSSSSSSLKPLDGGEGNPHNCSAAHFLAHFKPLRLQSSTVSASSTRMVAIEVSVNENDAFSVSMLFLSSSVLFFFEFFSFLFFFHLEHPKQLRKRISKISKRTNIVILTHTQNTNTYNNVCCYSTNRVRRRPQGHQGSGVYSTARSFFLFNNTDLIIGVFFSQSALLMMRIFFRISFSKNESTFVMMRERDLISDARCWSHRENERKRIRVTLLLVVALCVRGRRIRNASIEISKL
jgi:hypothetical protein